MQMENTYNLLKSFFSLWLFALLALYLFHLHAEETEPQAYVIYPKNGDVMHMKAFAYLQSNNIQKAIKKINPRPY